MSAPELTWYTLRLFKSRLYSKFVVSKVPLLSHSLLIKVYNSQTATLTNLGLIFFDKLITLY